MRNISSFLIAIVILGCGGGGGGGGEGAPPGGNNPCSKEVTRGFSSSFDAPFDFTTRTGGAGISLGQVSNATVRVAESDSISYGEVVTDSSGIVTIKACGYEGPLLVTYEGRNGATYQDEALATQVAVPFGPGQKLRAFVSKLDAHVGVTPFTEAAVQYLERQGKGFGPGLVAPTAAEINNANTLVQALINQNLPLENQIQSITRLPWISGSGEEIPNNERGKHGLVVSGFVQATAGYNATVTAASGPALEATKQLAADLADGTFDRQKTIAGNSQPISDASTATYTVDRFRTAVPAAIGALSQQFGSPEVKARTFVVDQMPLALRSGTSIQGVTNDTPGLPLFGTSEHYVWLEVMSDGSIRTIHPVTRAEFARETRARFKHLTADRYTALALTEDGRVFGIGDNSVGQLGLGNTTPVISTWTELASPPWGSTVKVTQVFSVSDGSLARLSDGRVFGWGKVAIPPDPGVFQPPTGYPSNGKAAPYTTPQLVRNSDGTPVTNAIEVFGNDYSYFILTSNGSLSAWGNNVINRTSGLNGRLGTGDSVSWLSQLKQVPSLSQITTVTSGPKAVFALRGDGSVWAWGNNFPAGGQPGTILGDPSFTGEFRSIPGVVPGLTNVIGIAASGATAFALLKDGRLMYWGSLPADVTSGTNLDVAPNPRRHVATPSEVPIPNRSGLRFVRLEKLGTGAVFALTTNNEPITMFGTN